jgi:ribosome-associated heat shock protein Hsp15
MPNAGDDPASRDEAEVQRLDKWLWFSRMLKSRTLAAQLVADGKVRINRMRVTKPSHALRTGDVLTIAMRGNVKILKVLAPGRRRGPPPEARLLYEVLGDRQADPEAARPVAAVAKRDQGSGRPSKRDRRLTDRLTEQE